MKIAAAQIRLRSGVEKNLANILHWLERAAYENVDIVNFPETSLSGYVYDAFLGLNDDEIYQALDTIKSRVKELGINAVVGTPWRIGKELYNSVAVLLADGNVFFYHKRNLVEPFETKYFAPGTESLVFSLDSFTFGTIVCRDQNSAPQISEIRKKGADVLFISCAHFYPPNIARLKVEKNRALPIVRAYENKMFVCKANALGTIRGEINLGHSLIVAPNGVVIAEGDESNETLLTYEINRRTDWAW